MGYRSIYRKCIQSHLINLCFVGVQQSSKKIPRANKINITIDYISVFKYHVSCADEKISVKLEITFNFRRHRCLIQLVVLVPLDLRQILLVVEVCSIDWPGKLTVGV